MASIKPVLQLIVVASDNGNPPKSASASVVVTVRRNNYSPTFAQSLYAATIDGSIDGNAPILTVSATDDDAGLQPMVSQVKCLIK